MKYGPFLNHCSYVIWRSISSGAVAFKPALFGVGFLVPPFLHGSCGAKIGNFGKHVCDLGWQKYTILCYLLTRILVQRTTQVYISHYFPFYCLWTVTASNDWHTCYYDHNHPSPQSAWFRWLRTCLVASENCANVLRSPIPSMGPVCLPICTIKINQT